MSKVTVVGAGNVGATCANVLAFNEVADEVVMLDVKEGVSEGKAMDMMQTAQLLGFDTKVVGCTNDYEKTANSDVVVITSGIPRKPGMTREELIGVNAGIVKSVAQNILKYSPNAILVVISNPMDTMTYLSLKSLGLPKNRIIGMGGALDSSRFKYFLSQALGCNANEVEGMVIGGHGDTTMIPLARLATYKGIPVSKLLSAEKLQEVVASTMVGGATLTKLLGTSAWYAPGAAGDPQPNPFAGGSQRDFSKPRWYRRRDRHHPWSFLFRSSGGGCHGGVSAKPHPCGGIPGGNRPWWPDAQQPSNRQHPGPGLFHHAI